MSEISSQQMEQAIEAPDFGQGQLFLDFLWLVPHVDGQIWCEGPGSLFPSFYLFTSAERMEPLLSQNQASKEYEENPYPLMTEDGWNLCRPAPHSATLEQAELLPLSGREIFARLSAFKVYHEVLINAHCESYDQPHRHGALRMPCGWIPLLMSGLDPRPETRILPAKSVAEIHRFMAGGRGCGEHSHQLEYIDGELAAVYEGLDIRKKPVRQAFTLVEAQADPASYGEGVSQILCGAMIAYFFDMHRWTLKENFHPGTRQGMFESVPELLRQLDEVLKMVDAETGRLPPECFRYPFAPSFVKLKPQVITRDWLSEVREELVRFSQGSWETRV